MADRFPLIITPNSNKIQELPAGDALDLGSSRLANVTDINATGVITATQFHGDGSNLTGLADPSTLKHNNVVKVQANASGAVITGVVTANTVSGTAGNFTGNLVVDGNISAGGTVTYDDVTNVDSQGIGTFRSGINVGPLTTGIAATISADGDIVTVGVITATTFIGNLTGDPSGSGANLTSIPAGQLTGTVADARISTLTSSKLTGALPAIDGSNLTGIDATALKDSGGNVKVQANPTGAVVTGVLTAATFSGSGSALTGIATSGEIDILNQNVALLGFKIATNGSLVKYSLKDQIIDEYQDASGIDAGASTNENIGGTGTLKYYSGAVFTAGNYYGDGSDGDVTISSSTDLTVPNTNGAYDGDMVLMQYNTLTINSGQTLSVNHPCRGLFIYVKGNCTMNGTIDMTAKGAYANPASTSSPAWGNAGSDGNTLGAQGLRLGLVKSGSSETFTNDGSGFNGCGTAVRNAVTNQQNISGNGKIYQLGLTGANGASGAHNNSAAHGVNGSNGTAANPSGGGGSGGTSHGNVGNAGNGAAGTCWSGGAGGAGTHGTALTSDAHGQPYGGRGGHFPTGGGNAGGAGNPGGSGDGPHGGTGETGTGGTVWLVVGGTFSGNGNIRSNGKNGGPFNNNTCGGGGGSGGGAAYVLSKTDSSSIGFQMGGGNGTSHNSMSGNSRNGGIGGTGYSLREGGLSAEGSSSVSNMTLQSVDATSTGFGATGPSKADMVLLIENNAGTATLNTDVKGYISRDSGSTWTQGTFTNEGSWGTNKVVIAFHNLDISAQPNGNSICYKIETFNQSASKKTYIHATSYGWS